MYAYTGCIWLYISVNYLTEAFRPSGFRRHSRGFPLFNDFIDNMLFECAMYKDQIKVKPNINLNIGKKESHQNSKSKPDDVVDSIKEDLAKLKLAKKLSINRIKFPIVGRVGKPETTYLRKIYYILEENNRGLRKNSMGDEAQESETEEDQRIMIHPRQITKIFTSPEVHQAVDMFPTLLNSRAPIIPGQVAIISLQEEHKELLTKQLRDSNIFGIFVALVTKYDETNKENPEISPHCMLCEFVDITNIDTTGKIVVRGIERFKISRVLAISEALIKGEVALLRDSREPLRNPTLSAEIAKRVEKLYDKCNGLEADYRRADGNMDDVKAIEARESFSVRLGNMIEDINIDEEARRFILELTGFIGLEYHADMQVKLDAANMIDTEDRLVMTKDLLEKKCEILRSRISHLSANETSTDINSTHSDTKT